MYSSSATSTYVTENTNSGIIVWQILPHEQGKLYKGTFADEATAKIFITRLLETR